MKLSNHDDTYILAASGSQIWLKAFYVTNFGKGNVIFLTPKRK